MLSVTLRSSFWELLAVSLLYFSISEMIKKDTNSLYPDHDRGSFHPDLGPNSLQTTKVTASKVKMLTLLIR